jgi:hypothetical protein|tara:strand:- start:185 stop:346 length:162 start_codon:yes stop_codon:yes gene_type:complete
MSPQLKEHLRDLNIKDKRREAHSEGGRRRAAYHKMKLPRLSETLTTNKKLEGG